jgi:predicted transcriptional regulator
MVVRDYMTSDVVHVEIPGNRDDVLKILKRTGISGVPVIKHKKIVGIITRKDLLRKPEETQLGLLMTSKPLTIAPDADVSEAARILVTKKIRRLPVVEDGHLLGLLSVADLIHAIAQKKIKDEIKDTYTSQTLPSGKKPRCRLSAGSWRSPVSMLYRSLMPKTGCRESYPSAT